MTSDREVRSAVFIEETYTYTIIADTQTEINCTSTSGQVRVTVPYDGRFLAQAPAGKSLDFGQLRLRKSVLSTTWSTCPIQLPIGTDLSRMLRSNRESVWEWSYVPDVPRDTLLTLDASIVDGPDFNPLEPLLNSKLFIELLFGNVEAFVNDLRLHLDLWVPRLNTAVLTSGWGHELRSLLLEQENKTQIFIAAGASDELLAQSLAALANTSGGRLLIGVKANGSLEGARMDPNRLKMRILHAALQCDPPVVFSPLSVLYDEKNQEVVKVVVPSGQIEQHVYQDKLWFREGASTISKPRPSNARSVPPLPPPSPIGDLSNLVAAGAAADVMLLGSKDVEVTADELGYAITALVNSEAGQGIIIVRHLASLQGWSARLSSQNANQSFEKRINSAVEGLLPKVFNLRPEYATIEGEHVVVLRIKGHRSTVAMYKGIAYEWTGTVRRKISEEDVYRLYMRRSGQLLDDSPSGDLVTLLYGDLSWPSHPPITPKLSLRLQDQTTDGNLATFDHQVRAMVWHDRNFINHAGTQGSGCRLSTRLRHAFAKPNSLEKSTDPNLNGFLQIKLDKVLASGLECEIQAKHPLLEGVPVYKHTQIIANLQIKTPELFLRRRKASLIHFQIPDVASGSEAQERIFDLQQICADLGFWVEQPVILPSSQEIRVLLRGFRNTHHNDIYLILGFRYITTDVMRELSFKQRVDRKQIKVGHLDVRIVLTGIGNTVSSEMTLLQLELSQLIHDRLHYLRTE